MSEKTRKLCLPGEAAFPNAASRRAGTSPRRSTLQSWAPGALGMQPVGQGGHLVLAMPPQMPFSIRKVLGECWAGLSANLMGCHTAAFPLFCPSRSCKHCRQHLPYSQRYPACPVPRGKWSLLQAAHFPTEDAVVAGMS